MKKAIKTTIYVAIVILVFSVMLCVKAFILGNFTVKGDSMETTLSDGDIVWAAKLAKPTYGDIIIVDDGGTNLVKRAVGFGGDKLWIEQDNEQKGSKWYLCRKKSGSEQVERLTEEAYDGVAIPQFDLEILTCHLLTNNEGNGAFDEQTAYIVPTESVYALGDNRNISSDSRSRGAFPLDDVVGVVRAKGMTVVYVLIAVVAVIMAVLFTIDGIKSKKAQSAEQKQSTKADILLTDSKHIDSEHIDNALQVDSGLKKRVDVKEESQSAFEDE